MKKNDSDEQGLINSERPKDNLLVGNTSASSRDGSRMSHYCEKAEGGIFASLASSPETTTLSIEEKQL